jgi:radical SAM superfamily enzyme YgiQ (UPF0313 family)
MKHYLIKHGIECDIYDFQLHRDDDEIVRHVGEGLYDIVGCSATHWNAIIDLNFHWTLREAVQRGGHECLFIVGGNSATQDTEFWLDAGFDLAVLGFGEETLLELCRQYENWQTGSIEELAKGLPGVSYRDSSGKTVRNQARLLDVEEFQNLSFTQAMEMVNPYREYWVHVAGRGSNALRANGRSYVVENARLYTTSHCAAACGFCTSPTFISIAQEAKATVHALTPAQVQQLISHHCREFGARAFSFNDENFMIGNQRGIQRVIEICRRIIESKRAKDIPADTKFSCQARGVDFLMSNGEGKRIPNLELINVMFEAGFHNVSIGVETFSDRLMKMPSINKGMMKIELFHLVLGAMMGVGLFPTINVILGIPESTTDELLATIEEVMHYLDRPCQVSIAHRLLAFPGARIWSHPGYPMAYHDWAHPITGKKFKIPYYFIPQDSKIADLIVFLEDAGLEEVRKLKADMKLEDDTLMPRTVVALCTFTVITRFLGASALFDKVQARLHAITSEMLTL